VADPRDWKSFLLKLSHGILSGMKREEPRPLVGVGVVLVRQGRIFLAKRQGSHGEATWASAGGHLEWGETLEECARREALEELGVVVGDLRFLCISNIIAYGKHYVDIEFLGDIGDQDPCLPELAEFSECGWFPLDNLPQPLFEPVRHALDSLRTGRYFYPENGLVGQLD
jgi:8-oxo-dGTP diphosphatase